MADMPNVSVAAKVCDIIRFQFNVGSETPNEELLRQHAINDLGADSLDAIEVVMEVEDAFDLSIPDGDQESWTTIQSIVDYVTARL